MNETRFILPPEGKVAAILDTDAFNEIDDQFAIAYMLRSPEKFDVKGICAAPFYNAKSDTPADGMRKSYDEILKLLHLLNKESMKSRVFLGSDTYLPSETEAVDSDAARFIVKTAQNYTAENPLYIVAIGAITNVASAILLDRTICDKCVVVWLGGNALHMPHNREFNLMQDVSAARVVFESGMPLVQLPCDGVVDRLTTTRWELEHWLSEQDELCDYLVKTTVDEAESYAAGKPWSRVIWDVCPVAWFFNESGHFMKTRMIPTPIPGYDNHYESGTHEHKLCYVYHIDRDAIFEHMFRKLRGEA